MASLILLADQNETTTILAEYITRHNFLPYEIKFFKETFKIEDARNIKKELSYKTKDKKLLVFQNEVTIEAQNALLKTIEESSEKVHFVFVVNHEDELLPTIHSRSNLIYIKNKSLIDTEFVEKLKLVADAHTNVLVTDHFEGVLEKERICALLLSLRFLLLDPQTSLDHKKLYYNYCKNTLHLSSLSEVNNVNERVILETIFDNN